MTVSTPASGYWLDDGTTAFAPSGGGIQVGYGKVAGSITTLDLGTTPWHGLVVFNTSAVNTGSGRTFTFEVIGSNTSDFSGAVQSLMTWQPQVVQQDPRQLSSVYDTVHYRYIRLRKTVTGTSPSITSLAFIRSMVDLDAFTLPELITIQALLSQNIQNSTTTFREWMTGTAWGGTGNDGKYPLYDGAGNVVMMKCPAQLGAEAKTKSPFFYGAIGSKGLAWGTWPSYPASMFYATLADLQVKYPFATSLYQEMDFLGWQAALYAGGSISVDDQYHFKMCNTHSESQTPLIAVAGSFTADCGYSEWHYEDMSLKTDDTEYATDANFATGSGTPWSNGDFGTGNSLPMVFGSGRARGTDNATDPATGTGRVSRFWSFGQQVTLQPGRYTVSCTLTAKLGASYGPPINNNQPSYAGISFFTDSPGHGSNPFGRSAQFDVQAGLFVAGNPGITQSRQFDIFVETTTTAWLVWQGGGYVNFDVTHLGIKNWIANTAVLCTRDGTAHHYPVPMGLENLYMWGPGHVAGVHAFRWKSFSNLDGNLVIIRNIMMQLWGTHVAFSDGAYLLEFQNVGGGDAHICIHTEVGTYNAGENIRFYGGGFGNSDILIDNEGGMELSFFGSSLDYSTQICKNNRGRIETSHCHIETLVPTDAAKPLFELVDSGYFGMHGGMFLGAGGVNTSPCAPISSNTSTCIFEVIGTELYNFTSDIAGAGKGCVMSGPGTFRVTSWRNKGNPNLGPRMISEAASMDLLGGAGTAETITNNTPIISGMGLPTSAIRLEGGVYFVPTSGVLTDLVTSQWVTSRLKLEYDTTYSQSGSKSIKVTKLAPYGVGDGCRLVLLLPAETGHGILGQINFLFPQNVGTGTKTIYLRYFWLQQIGVDAYGRPTFNTQNAFQGENDLGVALDGSGVATWVPRTISTLYLGSGSADDQSGVANGAPSWATHLAVLLDHESIPAMSYWIDNFKGNLV